MFGWWGFIRQCTGKAFARNKTTLLEMKRSTSVVATDALEISSL